ncbi:MAG: hypothetical protein MRERC_9c034 [Mycoplasmataceae bacterium RC_NB112A]|nr:MAG: hypothetical protein MRERC_9c034 [Mycoplasmataceae bacterium RC_NB112A]
MQHLHSNDNLCQSLFRLRTTNNLGKVLRVVSDWTTCSTACVNRCQFLWVLVLWPYYPGGVLTGLPCDTENRVSNI